MHKASDFVVTERDICMRQEFFGAWGGAWGEHGGSIGGRMVIALGGYLRSPGIRR